VLSTTDGTWTYDDDFLTYAYRWLRCDSAGANCVAITGEVSSSLLLRAADVGSRIRSEVTATEHVAGAWSGPITISSGGTYSGSWESNTAGAAITVATTQPVTINGRVRNLAGGTLIDAIPGGAVQLTVDHVFAYGGTTYGTSGRFIQAEGFKSLVVSNCTIENTRGIECTVGAAASSATITKNRHTNIKGGPNATPVGNFVQFRVCQTSTIEVSWNEIVNEYNLSEPEDIISIYHTDNISVTDNMLRHQSRIGNLTPSSQGSITIDASDAGPGCTNVTVEDNQVVDAYGIVSYSGSAQCVNTSILNNRIIGDRFLPNGQVKANGTGSPLTITSGGSNNHAHGNVVGYIDKNNTYIDQAVIVSYLAGASEGGAAEAANNTYVAQGSINAAAEQAEWDSWLTKLVSNGITVGA